MTLVIWFAVIFGLYVAYQRFGTSHSAVLASNQGSNTASQTAAQSATATQGTGASPPPSQNTGSGSTGSTSGTNSNTGGNGSQSSQPSKAKPTNSGAYKDGTYTGQTVNAYYGYVQVQVAVSGGKIINVKFLQYPNTHPTSVYINQQAMPYLVQEAVQAQNANVNVISGATFTSEGFVQSLASALTKAKNA